MMGNVYTFYNKTACSDNTANCIAEDEKGNIWFGTENGVPIRWKNL
ncbi:MAG: hypothetical protein IPP25_15000 [Saprospiraceae bacterium]|nr:hypothetical protein [Candidatus Opimibacter skivensis]